MDIERQLLFAVFALRGALIDLPTLLAACRAWSAGKETPLAEILVKQGALTAEDRIHLEYLLQRQLDKHQGNPRESLAQVMDDAWYQALTKVGNADLAASVAGLLLPPPPIANPDLPTRWLGQSHQSPSKNADTPRQPRYQRDRLHARGGIGQVWLAHDTEIDRDVALKELRPETLQSPAFCERFLEEARVTGQLEHPNIVPVHELVQPANGEPPYYVMRFVKGRTLSQAVDDYHAKQRVGQANRLDLIALLNAFHAVCNALAFAHARHVLHRDLKGQNVILGDFGEVIVLDWGLARRLGTVAGDGEPLPASIPAGRTPTLPGQIMGTPGYMAPEQAAGRIDRIDARTDVYGLGAILYEILTGQPPFTSSSIRKAGAGSTTYDLPALLQRIQTEDPQPPRQLHKETPAALEAICLKALARQPEFRYASAAELAKEVQRWLADEPVQAYREPFTVRLGRWGRRHKMLVTGLAVLLVCAVLGLTTSTLLINREREHTEQERLKAVQAGKRAERNFDLARDVVTHTVHQISEERLLNEPGMQPLRRELLKKAKEFFERLVKLGDNDPTVRREQGQTLLTLALLTSDISEPKEALRYLQEAEVIFTALRTEEPQEPLHRYQLGRCHLRRGHLLLLARHPGPATLAELELARQLLQTAGTTPEVQRELAICASLFGNHFLQLGLTADGASRSQRFDQALAAFTEAEQLWHKLLGAAPKNASFRSHLGGVYQNVAKIHQMKQQSEKGVAALRKSLDLHAQLVAEDRHNLGHQLDLGCSHCKMAVLLHELNHPTEALQENQNALQILEPLAQKNPTVILFQTELANVYANLATQQLKRLKAGDTMGMAQIRENYLRSLKIHEQLHQKYPQESTHARNVATTYAFLGHLAYLNRKADGLPWYNRALVLLEPLAEQADGSGTVRRCLADCHWGRAEALDEQGDCAQAVAAWDRFFVLRPPPPGDPLRLRRAQSRLRLARQLAAQENNLRATNELDILGMEAPLPSSLLLDAGDLYGSIVWRIQQTGQPFQAERLAGRVVAWWVRARAAGALHSPSQRAELRQRFRDVEVLSRRPDFQRLVRD